MRLLTFIPAALALGLSATLAAPPALAAKATAECGAKVKQAFDKQRTGKGWRSVISSQHHAGEQRQTFAYIPPASMHRTVELVGQNASLETIGIGKHAWFDEGNGWYEMQPQFAMVVTDHLRSVFEPKNSEAPNFICLGSVAYKAKTYEGFRTEPDGGDAAGSIVRTIYVDPETGLPAYNIISELGKETEPKVLESYDYPDNLTIEPPAGAPMATKN